MSNLPGDMWSLKLVQGAFSNHRIWPALPHAVAIYALSMATCRMTETNFAALAAYSPSDCGLCWLARSGWVRPSSCPAVVIRIRRPGAAGEN